MTKAQGSSASSKEDFDAIIIGAGFSGMYMLHSLRDKLDLNATVFEAGDGGWHMVLEPLPRRALRFR